MNQNEKERLKELLSYDILDTEKEESFDALARLAAQVTGEDHVLISMMDEGRQWHKAQLNFEGNNVDRELTFCQHTILQDDLLEVPDSTKDARFKNNPFVKDEPKIRFYAGMPLQTENGYNIGTICVIGMKPKVLNEQQKDALRTIAQQIMLLLDMRKRNLKLASELDALVEEKYKETTDRLVEKEKEVDYLMDALNLTTAIVEISPDGMVLAINDQFERLLHIKKENWIDKHINKLNELVVPEEGREWKWKDNDSNLYHNGLMQFHSRNGELVWIYGTYSPILNAAGETIKVLLLATDVSAEKMAEMESNKAKELAEKAAEARDNFIANMSHEIRTPMNAIIGFTELLEQTKLNHSQSEYVNAVKLAGSNLLSIINDILDTSKIESGMLTIDHDPFSLSEVLTNTKNILGGKAAERNIAFKVFSEPNIPDRLIGDAKRLSQILINLIGNAIKFTDVGKVTLNVEMEKSTESTVQLLFTVDDTGIGIPEEKIDHIFERFTQADENTTRLYGGTGLGLNISKRLIEIQGSQLKVTSQVGRGSQFFFSIEYGIASSVNPVMPFPDKQQIISQMKVKALMCEDNTLNQKLAEIVFKNYGYDLTIVQNGQEGVNLLQNETFDVVLMDLQMPVMDGYVATQNIRQVLKMDIPIIALTAHSLIGEKEKCLQCGMNDYVTKPFNQVELREKIEEAVVAYRQNREEVCPEFKMDLKFLSVFSGGNSDFEKEIIDQFQDDTENKLESLKKLKKQKDWPEIGKVVHSLKSSFGILGIQANALQMLENDIVQGADDEQIEKKVKGIMAGLRNLLDELKVK